MNIEQGKAFLFLLSVAVLMPVISEAAPENFRALVALFVLIINVATPALVALALVVFLLRMVGVFGFSLAGKEGEKPRFSIARLKTIGMWGIGILFVMVSIWGILRLIENTFLGNDAGALGDRVDEFCEGLDEC